MTKPKAVLIGDVHFSLSTLEIASLALNSAVTLALDLHVPLIVNGDLIHDKALLRGEVANRLIEIFQGAYNQGLQITINIGNHDRISEKDPAHSLNFLRPFAQIVDNTEQFKSIIPYCSTNEEFLRAVNLYQVEDTPILLVHQGLKTAYMGEYIKDESSVEPNKLAGRRIIASHYHNRQTIALPEGGQWDYLGSPYTTTFAEANDGPKGIHIVFDDGTLEFIPLNLRKHVIVERTIDTAFDSIPNLNRNDLLWMKFKGSKSELDRLDKNLLGETHLGHSNFKLDLEYVQNETKYNQINHLSNSEILDSLIDDLQDSEYEHDKLKNLWRSLIK